MASPDDTSAIPSNSPAQSSISGSRRLPELAGGGYRALLQAYAKHFGKRTESKPTESAIKPKPLTPAELHELYCGTAVPQHRYLAPTLTAAVHSSAIALDPSKWFDGIEEVNPSSVVRAWLNTNGNTEYEQLNFIGMEPNSGQLIGVLTVKQHNGYCGGPATTGSREFVAFWVDWGSGFEYVGTASVAVHDCDSLPETGQDYNVFLPVDLHARVHPSAEGALMVKIRAVLSWNTPPSTTNPGAPVVWGNSLEGQIMIPFAASANRGAKPNVNFESTGLHAVKELVALTGFPQKQTGPVFRSGFRLQPLEDGVTSK